MSVMNYGHGGNIVSCAFIEYYAQERHYNDHSEPVETSSNLQLK